MKPDDPAGRWRPGGGPSGLAAGGIWRLAAAILLGLWSVPALAGNAAEPPPVSKDSPSEIEQPLDGGPISTEEQLAEDEREVVPVLRLQWLEDAKAPYYAFKQRVEDELGLRFGADYTAVFQGASRSRGSNEASAGIFRFYGAWTLFGRDSGNSGALVYKVENRHDLGTSTAAQDLGGELGYVGLTALSFSDYRNKGWGLTNLQWRQGLAGGRVRAVAGIVDPTDYLDLYGLMSPWLHFLNVAFSTNPSIFLANQGVGAAVGVRATDHVYGILSVADANADPVDPLGSVDTFFDESEYFKHLEIGWSSSVRDRLSLDNIHLTLWHVDDQSKTGGRDGWGVAASAAWVFDERWLPFVRAGYSKDGGALYEGSVSWGVGYYVARRRDVLAIGMNWSRPSDTTIEPGLGDQYTMELFYRIQLAAELAITPDLQLIINPALDPSRDSILVAGLRLRLAIQPDPGSGLGCTLDRQIQAARAGEEIVALAVEDSGGVSGRGGFLLHPPIHVQIRATGGSCRDRGSAGECHVARESLQSKLIDPKLVIAMEFRPTSQNLPMTRAAVLQLASGALERLGLPSKSYASRAGVPLGFLDCDPEDLIPIGSVNQLLQEAGREVDGFGAIAAEVPLEAAGRYGRLVRGGLTVLDGLERSLAFAPDLGRVHGAQLIRDPKTGGVWLARLPSKLVGGVVPQDEMLVIRFMIQIAQLAAGADWKPEALRFASVAEATRALESVPTFQGVRAETGASWGGVLFPGEVLGLLLPETDCGALDDVETWHDEGPAGSIAVSLRQLLLSDLRANQKADISSVAESIEMHPRTMQRRLTRQGVSYREVLDQARYVRARELIVRHQYVSLTEVAHELGYGDLAAFSRAFRRWSGEPPSALRLRLDMAS